MGFWSGEAAQTAAPEVNDEKEGIVRPLFLIIEKEGPKRMDRALGGRAKAGAC
jgi:hypothetical protein